MKEDFLKYQAQTTPYPLGMEVSHAVGSYIYDTNNKKYLIAPPRKMFEIFFRAFKVGPSLVRFG